MEDRMDMLRMLRLEEAGEDVRRKSEMGGLKGHGGHMGFAFGLN